jgi:hypothetical protein
MSREAMQMALDMLNEIADDVYCDQKLEAVITALRQALETEQEPVAFINVEEQKLEWAKLTLWHTPTTVNLPKIPLYTAPPDYERGFVDGMQRQMQSSVDKALNEKREPVAWANSYDLQNFDMKVRTGPDLHHTVPLYTAPPKQWVGLTGNEARKFYEKYTDREELIYAIDKFLEEKNT